MIRFSSCKSVYREIPDDPQSLVLDPAGLSGDEEGLIDITEELQRLIDEIKARDHFGIVFLPEGRYSISRTILIPRAVRLIGAGEHRPEIILKANTPGYQEEPRDDKGQANYMVWFTGALPVSEETLKEHPEWKRRYVRHNGKLFSDANPGTFYSAVSNINFTIREGNPAAVVMRAHFAQHSFVNHCVFNIGDGKAGIFDIGNEMEDLAFIGGRYGIYTTKCSPGWPFVLVNSHFEGQREACVCSRECGLTFSRVSFADSPAVLKVMPGYWEKLFWKDCAMENIGGTVFTISRENNSCTQVHLENLLVFDSPGTLLAGDSGSRAAAGPGTPSYRIRSLTVGDVSGLSDIEPERIWEADYEEICGKEESLSEIREEIRLLPDMSEWISIKDFGAAGDGETDDTGALRAAASSGRTVYLPQGYYLVKDTIILAPGTSFIGLNPVSTQIMLPENAAEYAGLGSPKALIETSRGGFHIINGIGIDAKCRNPRAVGCRWMASGDSYMNDVKFVGGHGQIAKNREDVPVYNQGRTGDADPDRPWDVQYWSLWITENGGGVFKDIWSADTYALAGIFISETSVPGVMYQVSLEHHRRHELLLRNVSGWKFLGMQTEEEVAEGSWCQPYELSGCHDLVFGNAYFFRVIWVDNPYPEAVRAWNCRNIDFYNCHNYTQMKYTITNLYRDMNTGESVPFWQLAHLSTGSEIPKAEFPGENTRFTEILSGLDSADGMCEDSRHNVYICDSRLGRIYRLDHETGVFELLTVLPFRPLSLICDRKDNLIVVSEYKPVPHSVVNGVHENNPEEDDLAPRMPEDGSCYYMYYHFDRGVRVYAMRPDAYESSITVLPVRKVKDARPEVLYFPENQWRDSGDMMDSFRQEETECYIAPDGATGIAHHPNISRSTALTPLVPGQQVFLVDEYNKCIVRADVRAEHGESFAMENPVIIYERGEYGYARDDNGTEYIPDANLYIRRPGVPEAECLRLPARPANVLVYRVKGCVLISARTSVYALRY